MKVVLSQNQIEATGEYDVAILSSDRWEITSRNRDNAITNAIEDILETAGISRLERKFMIAAMINAQHRYRIAGLLSGEA